MTKPSYTIRADFCFDGNTPDDLHEARVQYVPEAGWTWTCCYDEEIGDSWSCWDTEANCLKDLMRHIVGGEKKEWWPTPRCGLCGSGGVVFETRPDGRSVLVNCPECKEGEG